ncbi:MAG: nucleotide exchange factor GrpE [Calditrichaeota bacterium]|nr:MAG: nucleotide exchange factor GrpE [Calditrichota bacterium]
MEIEINDGQEAPDQAHATESPTREESQWEERYKRLAADFANYKKRTEAEQATVARQAEDNLLLEMLSIYEDFARLNHHARDAAEEETLLAGIAAVEQKWQALLQKFNVEILAPEGEKFDHHLHDAVLHHQVADPEMHERVVQVIQPGYRRDGRVLRHAKVAVGLYVAAEEAQDNRGEDDES